MLGADVLSQQQAAVVGSELIEWLFAQRMAAFDEVRRPNIGAAPNLIFQCFQGFADVEWKGGKVCWHERNPL